MSRKDYEAQRTAEFARLKDDFILAMRYELTKRPGALSARSELQAWASAQRSIAAVRCYAAIARSL